MKREEKRKEDTMLDMAAKEAEEQETARNRKNQRLERADKQRKKLIEEIRRKASLAKSRREEENQRTIEREKRLGRAAVQRNKTLEDMHRMEWSLTTSFEEGQGRRVEVEKSAMIILVVGSTGDQGAKRKRGKKLRWSTEARRKAWERGMVKRKRSRGRRRLGEQMMEVESWLKEEQDLEYSSKETTQLGQNMMKLNLGGTSEGRTNLVNVETLFRALSIDERRAERWEKEEHDWLEDLDINMKEEESHEMMESRRFVGGEESMNTLF